MKWIFIGFIFLNLGCNFALPRQGEVVTTEAKVVSSMADEASPEGKARILYAPPATNEPISNVVSTTSDNIVNRKIIRNGQITIEEENAVEKISLITSTVKNYNGYIISSSESNQTYNSNYYINLKVPYQRFDSFILFVEKNCGKVISKNISATDVTEEFVDNEARLKAKKMLEERYFELLKQTHKVSEIIEVEEKLNEVRSDIETIEGRQKYLTQNTSYSELNISFVSNDSTINYGFKKLGQAFIDSFTYLFEYILILIRMLPNILLTCLLIWGIYSLIKKRKINLNIFRRKKEDKKDVSNG